MTYAWVSVDNIITLFAFADLNGSEKSRDENSDFSLAVIIQIGRNRKDAEPASLVAEHRRAGSGVVSLQVLQEYFVTVTRKLHLDVLIARRKVELLAEFDVAVPEVSGVLAAIDLHRLHGLFFWDALIVCSAKQAGCSILLSENFQQAREFNGVRVVNPFRQT